MTPPEVTLTIRELRELILAIDKRLPQVERAGEAAIASAARQLRHDASERIEELEKAAANDRSPHEPRPTRLI